MSVEKSMLSAADLEGLEVPEMMERRHFVASEEKLREYILSEVQVLRQSHERIVQALAVLAQHQSDLVYEMDCDWQQEMPKRSLAYSTRVRLREGSLTMVWESNSFAKDGKRYSRHMSMGYRTSSTKYNMLQFSKAKGDELENIKYVEGKYSLIRSSLESVRKLKATIAELERRAIKVFDTNEFD